MIHLDLRELLEEKTGALLLTAGGFLLIQIVGRALQDFVGFTAHEGLLGWGSGILSTGLLGFIGLAIPFIALCGLYHHLTRTTPRLAVAGGTLMALTPLLFVSGLLTMLIQPLPELPLLLWLSPLPYILGAGLFGVAFLWKNDPIRVVGIPLLVFSGAWALIYTIGLRNGEIPGGLPFLELLAVSLLAMGYILSTNSTTVDSSTFVGS